jgi:putative effector of murein hydrolase
MTVLWIIVAYVFGVVTGPLFLKLFKKLTKKASGKIDDLNLGD